MNITDKELLAICNLSNLKMEFANIIKGYKTEQKYNEITKKTEEVKIYTNHTIYSLLKKEYDRFKENFPIKKENIAFYQIDDKGKILPEYKNLEQLRKAAPIVMEYFDRYRESGELTGHEGEFLENWEIIYSADLYQIIIDNSYELYKEYFSDILKETGKILSKEEFIESNEIPSRDKIKNTNNIINIVDILKTVFLLGKYQNINLEKIKEGLEKIENLEDITRSNILESLKNGILPEKFRNTSFLFKAILRESDFKVIILKHENGKDFIITINDFNPSDEIAKSLREGKINYDLHILNKFFLSKIKANSSDNYTDIKYTGYGVGAQVALYMNGLNSLKNRTTAKIFTGKEKYTFDEIINFDLENSGVVLQNFEVVCNGFSDIDKEILMSIKKAIKDGMIASSVNMILSFLFPSALALGTIGGIAMIPSMIIPTPLVLIAVLSLSAGLMILTNSKISFIYDNLKNFGVTFQKENYTLVSENFIKSNSIFDLEKENKKYYSINIEDKIFNLPKELVILLCTHNYYLNKSINKLFVYRNASKNLSENRNVTYTIEFDKSDFKSLTKRTLKLKSNDNNMNLALQDITSIVEDTTETISEENYNEVLKIEEISQEINMSNLLTEIGYLQQSMNFNTFSLKKTEIVYMDIVPKVTSKLNEVKYTKSSSFVYFPFIRKDGMLAEEIREEYIGTILRSLYGMKDCKYDTLEHVHEKKSEDSTNNKVHIHSAGNYINLSNSRTCSDIMSIGYRNRILKFGLGKISDEHVVAVKLKLSDNIDFLEKFYEIKEDKNNPNRGTVLIGILNDEKSDYAKDKIGFIYNSEDRLYGCILEEKLYFTEQSSLEEISTTGVCDGATLSCSGGTTTSSLKVTSQNLEETNGKLLATEGDCIMNSNISPFGDCKLCGDKDKACIKHWSLGKWEGISIGQEIDGKKILINTSKLECKSMKGIISIVNSNTPGKDN